ncbi:hypothetical protein GVX82_04985 [Patescibacteria group bacterium]|jgi:hypothetical protein|nr:hypothetical protein [Patescibacteria group bacterium]
MLSQFLATAFPEPVLVVYSYIWAFAPIWLPLFLSFVLARLWVQYVRARFISSQEYVLLELKVPREVLKTPAAMETIFAGLHNRSGESTFIARLWEGKVRNWYSLELVSIEGQVHLFIWCRKAMQKIVENNFYAQFPDMEIVEADDYTRKVRFDLNELSVFGVDFVLTAPDPLPIKTYVDMGLTSKPDLEPEYVVDPLAHILEFLGSAGPGEQIWMQILIRVNKPEKPVPGKPGQFMDWKQQAKREIDKIRRNPENIRIEADGSETRLLSKEQEDQIAAMQRSITKLAYDTGIRGVYLAKKENFNPTMIGGMVLTLKQFNSETLNGFKPTRYLFKYDYPWQDFGEYFQNRERYRVFDAFRRRSWFYEPYKTPHFVLNTEELATIFHLPNSAVKTPTLERVPSAREGAPANLPL